MQKLQIPNKLNVRQILLTGALGYHKVVFYFLFALIKRPKIKEKKDLVFSIPKWKIW